MMRKISFSLLRGNGFLFGFFLIFRQSPAITICCFSPLFCFSLSLRQNSIHLQIITQLGLLKCCFTGTTFFCGQTKLINETGEICTFVILGLFGVFFECINSNHSHSLTPLITHLPLRGDQGVERWCIGKFFFYYKIQKSTLWLSVHINEHYTKNDIGDPEANQNSSVTPPLKLVRKDERTYNTIQYNYR